MSSSKARPHVVHVFHDFGVGGAQVRLAAIAAELGDAFAHTVVSLSGGFEGLSHFDPALGVQRAPAVDPGRGLPARLARYGAYLDKLSPDLLVTYNWGAIEFALANMPRRTPHLHAEDGFGPEETTRQLPRRVWTRRLALARSQVVVPSETLREVATKVWRLNSRRVRYIPNGIAERDSWSTDLGSLDLGLPSGRPIVAWVGAIRPEKNPLRLLRVFAAVKDEAVLLIIGDGNGRAAVETEIARLQIGDRVRLLGQRTDARDLIMQSDVLALTSDTEQMPLAVLEAMDAGLPVVSTDVGDVRRMVDPLNAPFVTSSEAQLAGALSTLIGDAGLRRKIGLANRERSRDRYALATMIARWRALLEEHGAA